MAEKMMRFDTFHEWQRIMEDIGSDMESMALNEAFSSSILRTFASQESGSRWNGKFAKDFYNHSSLKLDKITNEDFIILSNPTEWWTQGYAKNNSAIGFFVLDNPEGLKQINKEAPTHNYTKNSQQYGLVLTIMRGKVGMWYGFKQDPGQFRNKKSPQDRYGILSDEWDIKSVFGWGNDSRPAAKITRKNLELVANKVYVLDIAVLREKYGDSKATKDARADAKLGATALVSNRDYKDNQQQRYQRILNEKMDPKSMMDQVRKAMTTYLTWFTKKVDATDFSSKKYTPDFYRSMEVKWGSWNSSYVKPIDDMWRIVETFMREYNDYLRDAVEIEKLQEELSNEKDETKKMKLQSHIDYYGNSYERFVKKAIQSRNDVKMVVKQVEALAG